MINDLRLDVRKEWFPAPMPPEREALVQNIKCLPGRVLVEMASPSQRLSVIQMPTLSVKNERPDIGFVISRGKGVSLFVGDIVIVRSADGTWRDNVQWGDYKAEQVRTYGIYVDPKRPGEPELYGWWDSILATWDPMNEVLRPTEDNLLVERLEPATKTKGGLHLPEKSQKRSGEATIVSVGPRCREFSSENVGDMILYNPRGVRREIDLTGYGKNLAFLREDAIEAVIG